MPKQRPVPPNYRTFEPPPARFNPRTASDRLLLRHGFPRRPNAEQEPRLRRLWDRAVQPGIRLIEAKLAPDPIMRKRNPLCKKTSGFDTTNWAGVVSLTSDLNLSPPVRASMVYGQWAQPFAEPYGALFQQTTAFWIGMDGYTNGQVLQAGTAVTIKDKTVTHWAWTEWWPNDPVQIQNFKVAPGDLITCMVCAPQTNQGQISMLNETTQIGVSVAVTPPSGVILDGTSAEWIIETIGPDLIPFSPYPSPFNGKAFLFGGATADATGNDFNMQPNGIPLRILGRSGNALTETFIGSPSSAVIFWEGLQ